MREEKRYSNYKKCKAVKKIGGNSINGKKVVAKKNLKKGEVVCYVCGTIYNEHDDEYEPADGEMRGCPIKGLYVFKHRGRYMRIEPRHHISRFINHSCKPSCYIKWNDKKQILEIRAKRALNEDDEITINYSRRWFECHDIECQCGSEGCWGNIFHNNKQSKSTKAKSNPSILISEEGKSFEKTGIEYERDPKLRKSVIERDGYVCRVCGKSLEETYGSYAKKLIEVHHCIPVSSNNGASFESSIEDMIAICPNCHRVLHHCFPEKPDEEAIEELQNQIQAQRTRKRGK